MAKIANYTLAAITLPRVSSQKKMMPSITIGPGRSEEIPDDLWKEIKKISTVQSYIDHGLLKEMKRVGNVDAHISSTIDTEAIVPEHLADADMVKDTAKAQNAVKGIGIRKRSVGKVEV